MNRTLYALLSLGALITLPVTKTVADTPTRPKTPSPAQGEKPKRKPITVDLELSQKALDMDTLKKSNMGYMPTGIELVEEKPIAITKEPPYRGKPKYGAFVLGSGPKRATYFAIDEVKGEKGRIYIDVNQNGDLSDDGAGNWDEVKEVDGVTWNESRATLHASWGTGVKEKEAGSYTLFFYRRQGDMRLNWTKVTARSGKVELGGKTYSILLAENESDAIFTVSKMTDRTRRPVQFLIDIDGDGTFKGVQETVGGKKLYTSENYFIDKAIQIGGEWWDLAPNISGSELTFSPTVAPGDVAPQIAAREEKELLPVGAVAPDFVAQTPKGAPIRLSGFKGKVVLIDFWATWCGPCIASMPGLQKIYNQVKDKDVVVFSVNVFDEKEPFDGWIEKNSGKVYNFTFAFDPAGRDQKKSIAASKYNVSGIPTMYIVGRDGKIKSVIVGSGNEKKIAEALGKLGVSAKTE